MEHWCFHFTYLIPRNRRAPGGDTHRAPISARMSEAKYGEMTVVYCTGVRMRGSERSKGMRGDELKIIPNLALGTNPVTRTAGS